MNEQQSAVERLADQWNETPDWANTDYDQGRVDQRHEMTRQLLEAIEADRKAAGVVTEEPESEYGVKFDWKPEPSYVGSYENCRYFMDQPNDSLEKHAYPDDTKTLLRRRKAGPWAPVKQEGAETDG